MHVFHGLRSRLLVALTFLILPLILLAPVILGGRSLLPVDNLISYEPWQSVAADFGLGSPDAPRNALISDLILENYVWKRFILQAIESRELPLWNPYIFAGAPFLASGQHSMLYPFTVIFYLIPLSNAYGWFMLSQYFLAGVFAYLFVRGIGIGRLGALVGGVTYQLSLFMVVSAVFPMIVAGAIWLPLLLMSVERMIRQRPLLSHPSRVPWVCLGALTIGMQLLAGHPEIVAYSLLVAVAYWAWRSAPLVLRDRNPWVILAQMMGLLLLMVSLGLLLGAVQVVPQFEAASGNFRSGAASLAEVRGWGYPARRLLTFLVPNLFGNPSHHGYFSLFSWRWTPVSFNSMGESIQKIEWGLKNYVEGAAYVGILPLLLSAVGICTTFLRRRSNKHTWRSALFFTFLALVCLALSFGTPLYGLIYYLPGLSQLHTPFRWMWPFTLCVAVLASLGAEALTSRRTEEHSDLMSRVVRLVSHGSVFVGVLILFGLLVTRVFYGSFDVFIQGLMEGLALASEAFVDGRAFFSYEARWLSQLGLLLLMSGLILRQVSRLPSHDSVSRKFWNGMVVAMVGLDLLVAGAGFNPGSDPALLLHVPPVIEFLREDESDWRFTTYDPDGQKPFNANTGWMFDLEDVRGYDSIIPRQYSEYMELIEPQSELQYNRVSPISDSGALDSPLLDLLNVKYVITLREIDNLGYTLVYDREVRVYRNESVMQRAYALPVDCAFETSDFSVAIHHFDPRRHVILEPGSEEIGSSPISSPSSCLPLPAQITGSSLNQVTVDVHASTPVFLILADSYAPGWRAHIRPLGVNERAEVPVRVVRANGNFRAVRLEPGDHTVRFRYSPDSVKLGGFVSVIAVIAMLLILGTSIWKRLYRESAMDSTALRVAKNSLTPMAFNLVNRVIDFVFAMFYLRVLGPADVGNYTTAIVIVGWFDIWTNFGMNTWLTREASRDRDRANRYLSNTMVFRIVISGLTFPVFVGGIILYQRQTGSLGDDTVLAIGLLAVGMLFSSISTGLSALFYAYEKAEHPAAISSVTTLLKVALGTIVLVMGYGFVGLAGVTIVVNALTMVILITLSWRMFFRPRLELDYVMQRKMVSDSFPLMLNHLLSTLFFKIDVPMIRSIRGDAEVGRYSAAYKFVDAFNIIPSFFTFALFPIMSQQAISDRSALTRTYYLAMKLLVGTALPLAVVATFLAAPLVGLLGGQEFLPDGALALQLVVWSIPFGWINSVTNYFLIALGKQRELTRAFVVAVTFNVTINAIFIPIYGFRAAAISTILSEMVIGAAFQWFVYRHLQPTPWIRLFWRLVAAAAIMVGITFLGMQLHLWLGLLIGGLAYLVSVQALGVFNAEERSLLAGIVPAPLRKLAAELIGSLDKISVNVRG